MRNIMHLVFSNLFFPIDIGHFYQWLSYSAAQSHCSSAFGFPGSQQKNSSGNGSSKQRANAEGAHHHLHSSVQGLPNGGKGNFLLRAELVFRCNRQASYLFCCFFSTLRSEMNSSRPTWFVPLSCSSYWWLSRFWSLPPGTPIHQQQLVQPCFV